jgi:hypothetical protein
VNVFGQNNINTVAVSIDGPVTVSRTEGVAPYSAFGDQNGNFLGQSLPPGRYRITAFASDSNGNNSQNYAQSFDIGSGGRFLRSR